MIALKKSFERFDDDALKLKSDGNDMDEIETDEEKEAEKLDESTDLEEETEEDY